MKLALFREVLDLNQAFELVMRGLTKLEKVRAFSKEQIRRVRAEVETARVGMLGRWPGWPESAAGSEPQRHRSHGSRSDACG